eukprot:364889-Hanusia_phi.AAC.3
MTQVPPGAVEANNVIAMKVFEFEGKDPEGFSMEGRIVSNRVGTFFDSKLCQTDAWHPPAGRNSSLQYRVCQARPSQDTSLLCRRRRRADHVRSILQRAAAERSGRSGGDCERGLTRTSSACDPENADLQWEFHKLPIAEVDIERGVATLNITSTGIYYICSSSLQNLDFAVFQAKLAPAENKLHSFHLEGCKTDVLTGQPAGRKEAQTTHLDTDIYENISYMVQVIPEDLATTLENAKKELDEVRELLALTICVVHFSSGPPANPEEGRASKCCSKASGISFSKDVR